LFLIALAPLGALAYPEARTLQDFRVIYANQRATENVAAKVTLKVLTSNLSAVLGETSSNSIVEGNFASMPLSFDTDSKGFGMVTYGNSTYRIYSKKEFSGGIVCNRMYSQSNFLVDCIIPWKGPTPPTESIRTVKRNAASLRADFGLEVLPVLPELAYEDPAIATSTQALVLQKIKSTEHNGSVEARRSEQTPTVPPDCYGFRSRTQNRDGGDGFPHQNYYHVQQSVISSLIQLNNPMLTLFIGTHAL
jgi:hypothetical protein